MESLVFTAFLRIWVDSNFFAILIEKQTAKQHGSSSYSYKLTRIFGSDFTEKRVYLHLGKYNTSI